MTDLRELPGYVEVWNSRNERVSDREACAFIWDIGPGGAAFQIVTRHDLALHSSTQPQGWALVITDNEGRLLAAHAIAGRRVNGVALHIEGRQSAPAGS